MKLGATFASIIHELSESPRSHLCKLGKALLHPETLKVINIALSLQIDQQPPFPKSYLLQITSRVQQLQNYDSIEIFTDKRASIELKREPECDSATNAGSFSDVLPSFPFWCQT